MAKNGSQPANGGEQQVIGNEMHNNRQVFLLSGRRRKKSKTYLISANPFEINRTNSIAKLKSNIIGTEFNTLRILHNNQRLDYATIIYVSLFLAHQLGALLVTTYEFITEVENRDPNGCTRNSSRQN